MYRPYKYGITLMSVLMRMALVLLSTASVAGTVTVVDSQGVPFQNAVITFESASIKNTSEAPLPERPAIMDQVKKQFDPKILVIRQGQTVVFPNSDSIRHHVYSFSSPKPFEIKLYAGDIVPPVQFDKPGIVVLGCNIHDSMLGFIYVQDNKPTWVTDENGQADIGDIDGDITIWHPDFSVDHLKHLSFIVNAAQQSERTLQVDRVKPLDSTKRVFGSGKFTRQ